MREIRNTERTTVVNTSSLLKTLKDNRASHLSEYQDAVEGYLEEASKRLDDEYKKGQAELNKAFKRTQEELKVFDPEKAQDTIVFCRSIQFNLMAPRNFVDAYDQAIQMMEWETRTEVELTTTEFRCFIMNKWDWMESFKVSTESYLNK